MNLLFIIAILFLATFQSCNAARYQTVGHQDTNQFIQLKSQYDIGPGSALVLPIEVRPRSLSLLGRLPPRLTSITSINPDNIYGAGDKLTITLTYISNVLVIGGPTLTVNTGCHSDDCKVAEIQAFTCRADEGMFALRMEDQFIMNIDVNTTQSQFKNMLELLEGVHNVSIAYSATTPSNKYETVHRICTSHGNTVTIHFWNVSFPQYDGNVPTLEFDVNNQFIDVRTGVKQGTRDYLRGVHTSYDPSISSAVIREGMQQRDGEAVYRNGSGTNTIDFELAVRRGDSTGRGTLAVKSINFKPNATIVSPITLEPVSSIIPNFLGGMRFMSNISNILGNRDIVISFDKPRVKTITSTLPDGIYTVGDTIPIIVVFNYPVKIFMGDLIYLVLSTGLDSNPLLFNRQAYLSYAINTTTLVFIYEVQPRDVSPRLDVRDSDSLVLGGGAIYLDNASNDTEALLTLPVPGSFGSLSANKAIQIDTLAPLITKIEVASPGGIYTGGDSIFIDITYTNEIIVVGSPILWLSNNVNPLNISVIDAPAFPQFAYGRAQPGSASQIYLNFLLNFDLFPHDSILINLPSFQINIDDSVTNITLPIQSVFNHSFVATWVTLNESLYLTTSEFIPRNSTISLSLNCSAGFSTPLNGVSSSINNPTYSVIASAVQQTDNFIFQDGYSLGVQYSFASFSELPSGNLSMIFVIDFPETLSPGDTVVVYAPYFVGESSSVFISNLTTASPSMSFQWNSTVAQMTFTIQSSAFLFNCSIDPTTFAFGIPSAGVYSNNVQYSARTLLSGNVEEVKFEQFSPICGVEHASVEYLTQLPGAKSAVNVSWIIPTGEIFEGDLILIKLPTEATSLNLVASSVFGEYFNITQISGDVQFKALAYIAHSTEFSFLFDAEVGFTVPVNGITIADTFSIRIVSSTCAMLRSQYFAFKQPISSFQYATASLSSLPTNPEDDIEFTISLGFSRNLFAADVLRIYMPNLYRNPYVSHSVNISSVLNATAEYNLYEETVTLQLNSDFINPHSNYALDIFFPYSAGFRIAPEGLPLESFTVSIISVEGMIDNWPITLVTPCFGFCKSNIKYSHSYLNIPIVMQIELALSEDILIGKELIADLSSFSETGSSVQVSISCYTETPSAAAAATVLSSVPLLLNFTTPCSVVKYSMVYIFISNLQIVDTVLPNNPIISIELNNYTYQLDLPLPVELFSIPLVSNVSLSFSNPQPGGAASIFLILKAVSGFNSRSFIRLNLPLFKVNGTISSGGNSDVEIVSISSSGLLIDIILTSFVLPFDFITFTVNNLVLPISGLNADYPIHEQTPSFALSVSDFNLSPFILINEFDDVVSLYSTALDIQVNSIFEITTLTLSFQFSTNISAGDTLEIVIPGLAGSNSSYSMQETTNRFSAYWNDSSSIMQLTALVTLSSSNISISVFSSDNSGHSLILPSAGFSGYTTGLVSIFRLASQQSISSAFTIQCTGICQAYGKISTPKAGFASDYTFTLLFGGKLFAPSDLISLSLIGFSRNTSSSIATTLNSIAVYWNASTSTLNVQALLSFSSASSLTFTISADQSLALPFEGIRRNQEFNVSWMSSAVNLVSDAPLLRFDSVGKIVQSNFIVESKVPGGVSSYDFTMALQDGLQIGDMLLIGLPNATVPAGPIDFFVSNFNISADGIPADDTSSLDFFHTSTILLSIHETILPLQQLICFIPVTALILVPSFGFGDANPPAIAVVSEFSSITTVNFNTFSTVGAMSPSSLFIQDKVFTFTYTILCSPESSSKLKVFIPNARGADQQMTTSSNLGVTAISSGVWVSSSWTMEFQFLRKLPVNTVLIIVVTAPFLTFTSDIYYRNDDGFKYSLTSTRCSMDRTSFDSTSPMLLASSSVTFSVPIIGFATDVVISLEPTVDILQQDVLALTMPYLATQWPSSTASLFNNGQGDFNNFAISSFFISNDGTVQLNLSCRSHVSAFTEVKFNLSSPAFTIPPNGIVAGSSFPLQISRHDSGQSFVVANGNFQYVEAVSSFVIKSVELSNPKPGEATGILLRWQVATTTTSSDIIQFYFPGFLSNSNSMHSIPFVSVDSRYLRVSWDPTRSILSVYILRIYVSKVFTVNIPVTSGFFAPVYGIAAATGTYQIRSVSSDSPVYWADLDSITVVPVVAASISFLSCEAEASYQVAGDAYNIFLTPGHGLNADDNETLILLQNAMYKIQYSSNSSLNTLENIISLEQPYAGSVIVHGDPYTELYTAPVRPAYYMSGNGTKIIRFAYFIRKGDTGTDIKVEMPSNSLYVAVNPDLNGGHLYRFAMKPSLDANSIIPNVPLPTTGISIDTSRPYIIAVTTSTIPGSYVEGDVIDFTIVFSVPVAIKESVHGPPTLLLHINPYSYVVAYYAGGSGTKEMTFVYTVALQHFASTLLSGSLITTDYPILQPLRSISNNYFGYIRRASASPLVDVHLEIPANVSWLIPSNISVIGVGPRVVRIFSNRLSERGDSLTAGDLILIFVQYSVPVNVSIGIATPYVLLDVGRIDPGYAYFTSMIASDTLEFAYQIQPADRIEGNLYLYCTCTDFFQRSFLQLFDGNVTSSADSSLFASLVLASSSSLSARLISVDFFVDNTIPSILTLGVNVTDGLYSPGDSFLVSINCDYPIAVYGYITLRLNGANSSCISRYFSGNNSKSVNFLYQAGSQSATCRLEYVNKGSLDTTKGQLLRFSMTPLIPLKTSLSDPGTKFSLGMRSYVIIDAAPTKVDYMYIDGSEAILPHPSLSISTNLLYDTQAVYRYAQESPVAAEFNSSTPNSLILSALEGSFDNRIAVTNDGFGDSIIYTSDSSYFQFSPLWVEEGRDSVVASLQDYWWSDFSPQSNLDIAVRFDRKVHFTSLHISLRSGTILNKAFSTVFIKNYTLTIQKVDGFDLSHYQIEYAGFITRCISNHAPPKGFKSVESALNEIPALRRLGVIVSVLSDSSLRIKYSIRLLRSPAALLNIFTETGSCEYEVPQSAISFDGEEIVTFKYPIRTQSSLVISSLGIVPAGVYDIEISNFNIIIIDRLGVEANSLLYEFFPSDQSPDSIRMLTLHNGIPRVLHSEALYSTLPGTATDIFLSICLGSSLNVGDSFIFTFSGFDGLDFTYFSNYSLITWNNTLGSLMVNITSLQLIHSNCMVESVQASRGVRTPSHAIYSSFNGISYSYSGVLGVLGNSKFFINPSVGFTSSLLELSNPHFSGNTSVSISFTLAAILPQSSMIYIYLPGFSILHTSQFLTVKGDYKNFIEPTWDRFSSILSIRCVFELEPAYYLLDIPLLDSQKIMNPVVGLSNQNPPTLRVASSLWNMTATTFEKYPSYIGVEASTLNITVERPVLGVSSVYFFIRFTRAIRGEFSFQLNIPDLFSDIDDFSLISLYDDLGRLWIWRNWNQTLTIESNNSSSIIQEIEMTLLNMTSRFIMKDSTSVTANDSLMTMTSSDAFLLPTAVNIVQSIPIILTSSMTFSSNIFTSNSIVSVSAIFNHLAYPGDTISFLLYGVNSSFVRDLNVTGVCADSSSAYFDSTTNYFSAKILQTANCSLGISSISWVIISIFGVPYPNKVTQIKSSSYKMSWDRGNISTGLVTIDDAPIVGIMASAIRFSDPYSNEISAVSLEILVACDLNENDEIIVYLPEFKSSNSTSAIEDTRGNIWNLFWMQSAGALRLVSSGKFPPFAFNITIPRSFGFHLPSTGISSSCDCILVTVKKQNKMLQPQAIQVVQNVGAVVSFVVTAAAQSKFSQENTFSHRNILFEINAALSQKLNLHDEIHIYAPAYTFYYNSPFSVVGSANTSFTAYADYNRKTIVLIALKEVSSAFSVSLLPTDAVGVPLLFCDASKSECPLYVSIQSSSCPVRNFLLFAKCTYLFPFTKISMQNVHYIDDPTGQPTGVPTAAPFSNTSFSPTIPPTVAQSGSPSIFSTLAPSMTVSPTNAPTALPSFNPSINSCSPITSVPSCLPTGQPSSQPSSSPTQSTASYMLRIDLSFIMQTTLPSRSSIIVTAPQILSLNDLNSTAVLGNQSSYWFAFWNGSRQALVLTAATDMSPGLHMLSVVSSTLIINDQIIYENDSSIIYSILYNDCELLGGPFDGVVASGLRYSSLAFANISSFGAAVAIIIDVVAERGFSPGDFLYINLPNFNRTIFGELDLSSDSDTSVVRAYWNSAHSRIKLSIQAYSNSFHVVLPVSNEISIPEEGCNAITGIPTLSLEMKYSFRYSATPFLIFQPVAKLVHSSVSFSSGAAAGHETVVHIRFAYGLELLPGDVFDVLLPNFWSISSTVMLSNGSSSAFDMLWLPCKHTVQLVAKSSVSYSFYNFSIDGLRLPVDGINIDLSKVFKISSNATNGEVSEMQIETVQLVGYFKMAALQFQQSLLTSLNTFTLTFQASFAIKQNESLYLRMPGFSSAYTGTVNGFSIAWDASSDTFNLISNRFINVLEVIEIFLNNSVLLPSHGVPSNPNKNNFALSSDCFDGPVSGQDIVVDCVGVDTAEVHYDIGELNTPIGMRFVFNFCFYPEIGDTFEIFAPLVLGSSNSLTATGSEALESFQSHFNVSYSSQSNILRFITANAVHSSRIIVIYWGRKPYLFE